MTYRSYKTQEVELLCVWLSAFDEIEVQMKWGANSCNLVDKGAIAFLKSNFLFLQFQTRYISFLISLSFYLWNIDDTSPKTLKNNLFDFKKDAVPLRNIWWN